MLNIERVPICLSELFNIHFFKIPLSKVMKLNAEISLINYLIDHIFIGGITQKHFLVYVNFFAFLFHILPTKNAGLQIKRLCEVIESVSWRFSFSFVADSALSLELLLCLEESTFQIEKLYQHAVFKAFHIKSFKCALEFD